MEEAGLAERMGPGEGRGGVMLAADAGGGGHCRSSDITRLGTWAEGQGLEVGEEGSGKFALSGDSGDGWFWYLKMPSCFVPGT